MFFICNSDVFSYVNHELVHVNLVPGLYFICHFSPSEAEFLASLFFPQLVLTQHFLIIVVDVSALQSTTGLKTCG